MNAAFRRSEALTRLENLSHVIVEHLALVTWFPEHVSASHWKKELKAFQTAMQRYNTGKGQRHNFTYSLALDTLMDTMFTHDDKDYLLIEIEAHGVTPPAEPDWAAVEAACQQFAELIRQ